MSNNDSIIIKVFNENCEASSITSLLEQVKIKEPKVQYFFPKEFQIFDDEIIVFLLDKIESEYFDQIVKVKNEIKNKIIYVIPDNSKALLVSTIAKLGYTDIFILPYEVYKLVSFFDELLESKAYLTSEKHREEFTSINSSMNNLIGESDNFKLIIEQAKKAAENPEVNVLITGETGTGKGLLARAIHNFANNSAAPFVDIICTAIPENLLESELFGYEPGSFTHAQFRKYGLFEMANNGTIFLDEIGDLSLPIQAKLLRVIEKKVMRRLGGLKDIPINSRIISATNRNLENLIEQGMFRRDLFHRLNVVSLHLPPLRERGDDSMILTRHFMDMFNKQFDKSVSKVDKNLKEFITGYSWPGNVRELRNAVERAVLLNDDFVLKLKHFSSVLNNIPAKQPISDSDKPSFIKMELNFTTTDLQTLDKLYASEVLRKLNGNKSQTSKFLNISRPKLDTLLK